MINRYNIHKGDRVIVASLEKTDPAFQSNSYMRKMVGKEFEVEDVQNMGEKSRPMVYIRHREGGTRWTFHPGDLEPANIEITTTGSMPKEKIMFDPKELL